MKNVFPVFEGRQIPSEKKKNMLSYFLTLD